MKTASADSFEAAQKRLYAESPGWNFDGIHQQAQATWAKLLNTIEVKGGTDHESMLFYSNFFPSFASPRLVARKGEPFRGFDGKIKTADYDRYGPVPFWDTGRDQIVLRTLVEPKVKVDILRSTLEQARETGFMQTSFHGDHAVWMYLGTGFGMFRSITRRRTNTFIRTLPPQTMARVPISASTFRRGTFRLHPERQSQPSLCGRQGGRGHNDRVCLGRRLACRLRQKVG